MKKNNDANETINIKTENSITKYMESITDSILDQGDFFPDAVWTRTDLANQIRKVQNAKSSGYKLESGRLVQMIVDAYKCIGKAEKIAGIHDLDLDGLRVLAEDENLPVRFDGKELVKRLNENYSKFPKRKEYMKRVVTRLADKEFKDENGKLLDSTELTIVKQFVKHGCDREYTSYGGKHIKKIRDLIADFSGVNPPKASDIKGNIEYILSNIDESIFSWYENECEVSRDDSQKMKDLRKNYYILELALNLGKGELNRSRQKQITKEYLYEFAVAFNMTYYSERDVLEGKYDAKRDIKKNLFEDYYTASLFDKFDEQNELNLGDGIDYKKFAEVIYLYYLRKGRKIEELIDNRIEKAEQMIKDCYEHLNAAEIKKSEVSLMTYDYQQDIPFDIDESQFADYIKVNYCSEELCRSKNISCVWERPSQNSAVSTYKMLLGKLKSKMVDRYLDSKAFSECSDDLVEAVDIVYENIRECYDDIVTNKTEFESDDISREKLIALYCLVYLNEYKESRRELAAKEIYNDFCNKSYAGLISGINILLSDCRYQPFTKKNLFDVIILVIIYLNAF